MCDQCWGSETMTMSLSMVARMFALRLHCSRIRGGDLPLVVKVTCGEWAVAVPCPLLRRCGVFMPGELGAKYQRGLCLRRSSLVCAAIVTLASSKTCLVAVAVLKLSWHGI